MTEKKVEITLKVALITQQQGDKMSTYVELKGTDHDVMDLAEMAQHSKVIGEVGVDKILRHILQEKGETFSINHSSLH